MSENITGKVKVSGYDGGPLPQLQARDIVCFPAQTVYRNVQQHEVSLLPRLSCIPQMSVSADAGSWWQLPRRSTSHIRFEQRMPHHVAAIVKSIEDNGSCVKLRESVLVEWYSCQACVSAEGVGVPWGKLRALFV